MQGGRANNSKHDANYEDMKVKFDERWKAWESNPVCTEKSNYNFIVSSGLP